MERISRFFKNKDKLRYTKLSFEEFAERGAEMYKQAALYNSRFVLYLLGGVACTYTGAILSTSFQKPDTQFHRRVLNYSAQLPSQYLFSRKFYQQSSRDKYTHNANPSRVVRHFQRGGN